MNNNNKNTDFFTSNNGIHQECVFFVLRKRFGAFIE